MDEKHINAVLQILSSVKTNISWSWSHGDFEYTFDRYGSIIIPEKCQGCVHTHTHTHIQLADSATTAVWDGKLKIEQGVQWRYKFRGMCCCVIERVDIGVPVGTTHLIQHPISEDRYLQQHCCERASHLASVTLILMAGRSACSKVVFLKLWSADHKWSSGSALVVLLDWTLVQKRQKKWN